MRVNIKHVQTTFNFLIAVGVFILIIMFINFNSIVADNAKDTKDISANTNKTVKSQGDILDAIQKLAIDNKTTSDQKTDIIICMLQVPVSQRTTDTVNQCKQQVEQGGGQSSREKSSGTSTSTSPQQPQQTQQPRPATPADKDVIFELNPNTSLIPFKLPTLKITQ